MFVFESVVSCARLKTNQKTVYTKEYYPCYGLRSQRLKVRILPGIVKKEVFRVVFNEILHF